MNRWTDTWSPPAVQICQRLALRMVPKTVTRILGSKLNRGCASQVGCQLVGNQVKPPSS